MMFRLKPVSSAVHACVRVSFLALSLAAFAQPVFAEDSPAKDTSKDAPKDTKSDAPATTVTITGNKPQVENRIDRRKYDVKDDPQAKTGTAADVLNNVPSVNVDSDGTVSLRGQSNVQVLLNGKASSQLSGDARAATLQSMSADDIDSVEVITNPSAQFRSDGTGGIINIVTKRNRKPGASGALIANYGTNGRYNSSLSGSVNTGKLTLSGNVNVRHDGRTYDGTSHSTRLNPLTNLSSRTTDVSHGSGRRDSTSAQGSLDYNIDDQTTVTASINAAHRILGLGGLNTDHILGYDNAGVENLDYVRRSISHGTQDDGQGRLVYDHHGPHDGEDLKMEGRVSSTRTDRRLDSDNIYALPVLADALDQLKTHTNSHQGQFTFDYVRPLSGDKIASFGGEYETQSDVFDNVQTPNSAFSNDFHINQGFSALYTTYQMPFGKWTGLFGLRFEDVDMRLNQVTSGIETRNRYDRLNPSIHLSRDLTDTSKFKLSYSHRVQRPGASDLNPFIIYRDAQNVSAGNPNLKPQEVHSLEANYEYTTLKLNYTAGVYYRRSYNTITDQTFFISPTVLETTRINSGAGRSGGIEYSVNYRPSRSLSFAFNSNVFYAELQSQGLNAPVTRSDVSFNGKASMDYRPSLADRFQVSTNFQGRTLTAQGTRSGNALLNLAYSHKFSPKLSLVVTAQDVLNSMKFDSTTSTPYVQGLSHRQVQGQVVFVGLSYTFGGVSGKRDDNLIPDYRGPRDGRGGGGGYGGPGGGAFGGS